MVVTFFLAHTPAGGGHEVLSATAAADPAGGWGTDRRTGEGSGGPRGLSRSVSAPAGSCTRPASPVYPKKSAGARGNSQSLGGFSSAVKMTAPPGLLGCGKG